MATTDKAKIRRPCAVCGKDQYRKKVWEKNSDRRDAKVICFACAFERWTFDKNGNPKQKAWYEHGND